MYLTKITVIVMHIYIMSTEGKNELTVILNIKNAKGYLKLLKLFHQEKPSVK